MTKEAIIKIISLALPIIVCLAIFITHEVDYSFNRYEITATVTDKDVKNYDNDGKYLIFARKSDNETIVMEIEDNLLVGRFNSSDTYAEIEVGKTYTFTVAGQRVPFFSWYPNIYNATPVDTEQN